MFMSKKFRRTAAFFIVGVIILTSCLLLFTGCKKSVLDPANPTKITIWHYYNGRQLAAFDEMINEFNNTRGHDIGVYVEAKSQGGGNDLADKVIEAAEGNTGAEEMPNIFGSYADTAYRVDALGKVAEIDQYLTEKEIGEYVRSFVEEGSLPGQKTLKIFPIAKSSEAVMANKNIWDEFSDAAGTVSESDLLTWEGISKISEEYYKWTDAKTPDVPNDGESFFGLDSVANYIIGGSRQLGTELVRNKDGKGEYNLNRDILRKLWDIYYGNFVKGYFNAVGRYRSDDIKSKDIVAYLGSTTGSAYFPVEITDENGSVFPVDALISPTPFFAEGERIAVQQGAGMVVVKADEKQETASVEFLKWFTDAERNVEFASSSCYFPVKENALNGDIMKNKITELKEGNTVDNNTAAMFEVAIEQLKTHKSFWGEPYDRSYDFRNVLETKINEISSRNKAAYLEKLAEGMSAEEAYASIDHEAAFDEWYDYLVSESKK